MKYIKIALGCFNTMIGYCLGGLDEMLISLFLFMFCDYLSGVIKAIVKKKLSSEVGFEGILKKGVILIIVAISVRLDVLLNQGELFRYLVIGFYLANEGISILENVGEIGLKYPKKIKDALVQLNKDNEDDEGDE